MADPVPASALAGHRVPGRFGRTGEAAGVHFREITVAAMAQLSGVGDGAALGEALSGFTLAESPAPLRCTAGNGLRLLWTGPGQYLAVAPAHEGLDRALGAAVAELGGVAVDLGHARTVMQISGPACRDLLAKGCALDVDAMQAGDCMPTLLSHFNVLLHCEAGQTFEIYVTRSFAVSCFEWLRRAGEEFGFEVE